MSAMRLSDFLVALAGLALILAGVVIFGAGHNDRRAAKAADESLTLLESSDLLMAEKRIREALEVKPHDSLYLLTLARILDEQGEFAMAEAVYADAYKMDSSNPESLFRQAMMNWKIERTQAAVVTLERLRHDHPTFRPGLYQLGQYYFSQAEYDTAREAFEQIIKVEPEAEAYNGLGAVYYSLNRLEEARQMFEKALALDPSLENAGRNLETIEQELMLVPDEY